MTDWKAAQAKAWVTRRERHGPRGHMLVQKWRRKLSARAKRIADQSVVASVSRETAVPTTPDPNLTPANTGGSTT